MNKELTYIFGHKNPDTDSVCSAIALSYLKNSMGMNTTAVTLGNINLETEFALSYFGFKKPRHLNDVKLQIKDINYHKGIFIDKNLSIKDAFDYMNKYSLTGIPVVEGKNKYFSYISLKEIAREIINGDYHKIETSYGNLIKLLNAEKVLKFDKEIKGNVLAATYANSTFFKRVSLTENDILIIGDRREILEYAIESKVKLIILVANSEITKDLLNKAKDNKVNIMKTSLSSYEVGKTISLSNYIRNFVRAEGSVTFNEVDYLEEFLDKSKSLKHTNYPILNNKECKGLMTLTDVNNVNRKQVILVDHNNFHQSVDGLEEAEILEIIDHHNIGDIVTKKPINFRNSSCGCTATIVYDLYRENNVQIPKNIAGILASAIISDTLLLTSPTTTIRDTDALINLSTIAEIDYKIYGVEMLKHGMTIKGLSNEELLKRDFKAYKVNDDIIGIGQIITTDLATLNKKMNSLIDYLDEVSKRDNYKVVTLFITDIFENRSYCLYNREAEEIIQESFKLKEIYEGVILEGVVSRKVQIAPYIMDVLDK